ncbi:MAG TPA: hypothetical protein VKE94_16710 [Gemmataceae bacterium]|nr:hypothetical protein [Gemmataceae bacterium]
MMGIRTHRECSFVYEEAEPQPRSMEFPAFERLPDSISVHNTIRRRVASGALCAQKTRGQATGRCFIAEADLGRVLSPTSRPRSRARQ